MKADELIRGIEFGKARHYRNVTIRKIYGTHCSSLPKDLVTTKLKEGQIILEDSGMQGRVYTTNESKSTILIPGGIIFEGSTQNRTIPIPTLIKAGLERVELSALCTEINADIIKGTKFRRAEELLPVSSRCCGQDIVWNDRSMSYKINTTDNNYKKLLGEIEEDEIGVITAIDGTYPVCFAEMYGNQELYAQLRDLLIESVAITAQRKYTTNHRTFTKWFRKGEKKKQNTCRIDDVVAKLRNTELLKLGGKDSRIIGNSYLSYLPVRVVATRLEGETVQVSFRE